MIMERFKITPLEDEEVAELTVSSSRLAEKNKQSSKINKQPNPTLLDNPLIETTPIRNLGSEVQNLKSTVRAQDLMDSIVLGDPIIAKNEEKMIKNTKENILNRYNEVLNIEKTMMREIIEKDTQREKFLRDLQYQLEILQRENQLLSAENKSLKEMMTIWNIKTS